MDCPDRPNLALYIYEKIEAELHESDKSYWRELKSMCVFKYIDTMLAFQLNPPFAPPKRPMHLRAMLSSYARNLFDIEAREYPRDPCLAHWLGKLTERTRDRVMETVFLLHGEGLNGLAYHGLNASEMTETIDHSLQLAMEEQLKKSEDVPAQTKAVPHAVIQGKDNARFRPLDDNYQTIEFEGREYALTPTQSTIVRTLHKAHLGKRQSVGIKEIQKALGVNSGKMSGWFRGKNNKHLYGKLIVQQTGSRIHYRLDL